MPATARSLVVALSEPLHVVIGIADLEKIRILIQFTLLIPWCSRQASDSGRFAQRRSVNQPLSLIQASSGEVPGSTARLTEFR
jgi:hypothetical protein